MSSPSELALDPAVVLGLVSAHKSCADNSDEKEAAMQPHLGPEMSAR